MCQSLQAKCTIFAEHVNCMDIKHELYNRRGYSLKNGYHGFRTVLLCDAVLPMFDSKSSSPRPQVPAYIFSQTTQNDTIYFITIHKHDTAYGFSLMSL